MRKRVLIVEDDSMIADVLSDILETMDLESSWASRGTEALALIESMDFDLAILDLELPGRPGTEVAKEIKALLPKIKIIFSTGFSDLEEDIDTSDKNFLCVVRKPFEIVEIKAAIEKGLANH